MAGSLEPITSWLNQNPGVATVIGAVLLATVTGLLVSGRKVASLAFSTYNLFANRMHVYEITNKSDKHFSSFVDTYHNLFSDNERTATAEIIEWLEGKGKPCGIDYSLFLVRARKENVGIAIPMVKKSDGLAFIAYLGLTQEAARWRASEKIVKEILRKIGRRLKWQFLIIELDHPIHCSEDPDERRTRSARIRHFEALSKQLKYPLYFADFEYVRPVYHTDAAERDSEQMVLGIVRKSQKSEYFRREDILKILNFVYRDIYGGCLWTGHAKYTPAMKQIEDIMQRFETNLPILVRLPQKYLSSGG